MPVQRRTRQPIFRTGDQALVRQINLSVIMHQLRDNAPTSRAALAQRTGLNKTTVSSLVRELIERRFVKEVGYEAGGPGKGVGRLAMLLTLDPDAGYIVSAEIGVDFISVICTNFEPDIIWRHNENINPGMGQRVILDRALALLRQAVEEGGKASKDLLGVAVGVPGLVDQDSGTLLFAPNLRWENTPLRQILQQSFRTNLFVENEATMAVLGETQFGAAEGYQEVLYVSAGVGLGGGIVHNGLVYRGGTGIAGEIGHMTVNPGGELCACGNRGCWETEVSQRALFKHVRRAVESGQESLLATVLDSNRDSLTVPLVVEAAHAGDRVALAALQKVGNHLGIGIASLVNALNPELVVFGGILSLAGEFLLPIVQEEVSRRALRWSREASQIVIARHGFDACVMGGVAMVYQAILADPNFTRRHAISTSIPQSSHIQSATSER